MKKQQPYNKFWLLGGKYKEVSGGFTVYIQEYIFAELLSFISEIINDNRSVINRS